MTFEEISHSASRKSDKASERTYNRALEKMRKALRYYPDCGNRSNCKLRGS